MLRSLKEMRGFSVFASDGTLGSADDFFFDDVKWLVRYLVVSLNKAFSSRRALISPASFQALDWEGERFSLNLTIDQIRRSPDINADRPISRWEEMNLIRHYGWPAYWPGGTPGLPTYGFRGLPHELTALELEREAQVAIESGESDPRLRSAVEVMGYRIQATDGEIGHLEDLFVEEKDWAVRYAGIDSHAALPRKKVLIAPPWVKEMRWDDVTATVGLTHDEIRNSPAYDPSSPISREYEERLHAHYRRPPYWE